MEWEIKEKIDESRLCIKSIKDICQILEMPCVMEIPKSVFWAIEILCERVLAVLPMNDQKKEVQEIMQKVLISVLSTMLIIWNEVRSKKNNQEK